ncbi:MAG: COX15/CtaA family protein [Candidatus Eremiobacteraeota bacterium]|nr:COX15/CtaA family protein [Candidatus Eremiobacteraeota bacterium]
MRTFRALAILGVVVGFALAMLGSWTRINSAGMTCPDWPLCQGAVVPVLHGGVVLEWLHRLLAALETFVVAGLIIAGLRVRPPIPALRPLLLALGSVFVLQVLIGGATIAYANSPLSVTIHWGTAMLLLAVLSSLVVVAFSTPSASGDSTGSRRTAIPLLVAACWAWLTMCAGALVSSSGAGLACPSVPGCDAAFFGQTIPQALQMTHRFLAAALVVFAVAAAASLPRSLQRSAAALRVALTLAILQIALGVLNVVWLLPMPLREAHAANAVATFLAFVVATVFALLDGAGAPASVRDEETSYAL